MKFRVRRVRPRYWVIELTYATGETGHALMSFDTWQHAIEVATANAHLIGPPKFFMEAW